MWAGLTKTNKKKESITWQSTDWIRCTSPALDWFRRLAAAIDITTNTLGLTAISHNILSCNLPVHQQRASFLQALTESIIQQLFMLSINITSRYSIKERDTIKEVSKTGGKLWTAKCSLTATPSKDEIYVYKVGPHQIWVLEPSHQSN